MSTVSIVMPAYNAERHIEESVKSVIAQTFTDWELIIIDDASLDGTAEIAQRISRRDERVHFLQNPQNLGVARTRNLGLKRSAGEHIAFIDSDDVWREDKLQQQLDFLKNTNADLCFTSYATRNEDGKIGSQYKVPRAVTYTELLKENVIGCSTVLIKRCCLNGKCFATEFFHEDYVLWLQLLKLGCRAVGLEAVLVDYRMGGRSQDKANAAKQRWKIYRTGEKLSVITASYYFAIYCFNGLIKACKGKVGG